MMQGAHDPVVLDIPVHPAHQREVYGDPDKIRELARCATSFSAFLEHWRFLDQETGKVRTLGDVRWEAQVEFCSAVERQPKIFFLKARKLGETTIECAYDAWVARFRDVNARVHLFSRRLDAAKELKAAVKYGLDRLPPWMRLPYSVDNNLELEMVAGTDDKRFVKAYPTSKETAVEATCTHGHVDEWARMQDPRSVWQAIEPSLAGSAHILTTGRGPQNYASIYYRLCQQGDTDFVPIFIDAMSRPDRDERWFKAICRKMTDQARRQEFPLTVEDAMSGGGDFPFAADHVSVAGIGVGPQEPVSWHRYVKAWDIGRHKDAAVGIVLDTEAEPTQVVHYVRLRNVPYPMTQNRIEQVHKLYPGPTVIESNNAGEAVAENLNFREDERTGWTLFNTTGKSKPRIIEMLQFDVEKHTLQWSAAHWPQLDNEVRGYQIPDEHVVQDSVMALAIGNAYVVRTAGQGGKVLEPVPV